MKRGRYAQKTGENPRPNAASGVFRSPLWNTICTIPRIFAILGLRLSDHRNLTQKVDGAISRFLCENFETRPRRLPAGKYVSLCFDDFPQSAARHAAPMIEQRGWRATWYVAGGFMGQAESVHGAMFEAADLQALRRKGHDFGCHTFDHIDCRAANAAEIAEQGRLSAAFLRAHGIEDVRSFAFPFGSVDLAAKKLLSKGPALRGIKPGRNRDVVDLNLLKACGLQDNQGGTQRALSEIDALRAQDGWVIIFTHDVRETPSPWGVSPADYADLLAAIDASGAEVVTVGEMVDRLEAPACEKRHAVA